MTFAKAVQTIRHRKGLTQVELAKRAGLSPSAVRQLEQGQRTAPEFATVVRLARALEVQTDAFAECDEVRFDRRKKSR
jgi:transcriptional regulator with XRE-family HTH domain